MSERDGYESGVPCWVATIQPDLEAAAAFYGALFGWEYEDGGGLLVARLRGRDVAALVPLPPGVDPPPPDWITDIWVDSADAAADTARGAGGSVLAGPLYGPAGCFAVTADPPGPASARRARAAGLPRGGGGHVRGRRRRASPLERRLLGARRRLRRATGRGRR